MLRDFPYSPALSTSDAAILPDDTQRALTFAAQAALRYLAEIDHQPVRLPNSESAALSFKGSLPEEGTDAQDVLAELVHSGLDGVTRSSGPRFFHFVTGGGTPAALGADWLASALDQNAGAWIGAPLGTQLEETSVNWLKDLFGLPASWSGVLTTGATMANFTALAAARHWWAMQHGVDVEEQGLAGLPPIPILTSGYIHVSAMKTLAMLGIGRANVRRFSADDTGRLDQEALREALRSLNGQPAIIIANAGEVNAGDFDPIAMMADLAEEYGAWLHVDGAFGLFARVTPQTGELAAGIERAHSVISDGHKWLNVPYDCGFAFVRDHQALASAFAASAAYLKNANESHPDYGQLGPELSRRARGIAVWAALRAYGRSGYRAMVEHHLGLAHHVGQLVEQAPDLELLAPVQLNIVCFRFHPAGVSDQELDDLNRRIGAAVLDDGRIYMGTTVYRGMVAFRPAFVNWRTTQADVDLLITVVRELGAQLLSRTSR